MYASLYPPLTFINNENLVYREGVYATAATRFFYNQYQQLKSTDVKKGLMNKWHLSHVPTYVTGQYLELVRILAHSPIAKASVDGEKRCKVQA